MKKLLWKIRERRSGEDRILGVCLVVAFIVLLCVLKQMGASYDEPNYYTYAEINLRAIYNLAIGQPFDALFNFFNLMYYGAAYLILGSLPVRLLMVLVPSWNRFDAWHLLNFTVFLGSVWVIYRLCSRFVSKKAALLGALIYLFQPLLEGHAIINPKDSPFMAFFVAAVAAGFKAVDLLSSAGEKEGKGVWTFQWRKKSWRTVVVGSGIWVLLVIDRLSPHWISQPVFSLFAPTAFQRGLAWLNGIEFLLIVLGGLLGLILVMIGLKPAYRWLILAGILLGLTSAIRVLGPAAGGLVGLYAVLKKTRKPVLWLGVYAAVGMGIAYLFWPYLWLAPLSRFAESLKVMSNFPWQGVVRFEGKDYLPNALPWYYLPKLIGIQLTLPLLGLALVGMGLSVANIFRRGRGWQEELVLLAWFGIPLAGIMAFRPVLYDNFRQELFILPPLFGFAALAFDFLLNKISKAWLQNGLMVALLLPGVIASIWLFPYLYIYYNGLVGGTGQVGRTYETDYWGLSFCEAGRYLETMAPAQTSIGFTDQMYAQLFEHCSAKTYRTLVEAGAQTAIEPIYSVMLTRNDQDLSLFTEMDMMKTFGRGKTLFLVIKTR